MSNRLEINGVSKQFKKNSALLPFSLTAGEGECIALCGGNGAGKSTLLHIVAATSAPSSGTVLIENKDLVKHRKAYVSRLGYVPDEFFAQEALTVSEFLNFYARLRRISPQRVKEVIQHLGLEDKEHELTKHLSKGMRQRLLFGQAIIGYPLVLVLDEPTNGLDPYWIDIFIKLLTDLKKNGTTILFSTHMMDVAAEVADKVLFMEKGKNVAALINDHQNHKHYMDKLLHLYRNKGEKAY